MFYYSFYFINSPLPDMHILKRCLCWCLLLTVEGENGVLKALSQIIDPDFGTDIVSFGFIKDLKVDDAWGED